MLLFTCLISDIGVRKWQWIFAEAGYGKGDPDRVSVAIKRRCNELHELHRLHRGAIASGQFVTVRMQSIPKIKLRFSRHRKFEIKKNTFYYKKFIYGAFFTTDSF